MSLGPCVDCGQPLPTPTPDPFRCPRCRGDRDDPLVEAGRILRNETLMLAQGKHLKALAHLLMFAKAIIEGDTGIDRADWLSEVNKLEAKH